MDSILCAQQSSTWHQHLCWSFYQGSLSPPSLPPPSFPLALPPLSFPPNITPLSRIAGLCKDYCGILNVRLNFVLIYELLDEVLVSYNYKYTTQTHAYSIC